MENTTGQKSHPINYGSGQQRYFSLGISHSQSPGYAMCKKQKSQTKRKSGGFLSWLRKGFFFSIGKRKFRIQVKDQPQSGEPEGWATEMSTPDLWGPWGPPSCICVFGGDQPCGCSSPFSRRLPITGKMTTRSENISSAPHHHGHPVQSLSACGHQHLRSQTTMHLHSQNSWSIQQTCHSLHGAQTSTTLPLAKLSILHT